MIPAESRKGVQKYVLLFLLTEETKSTHTEKGHHTHIVQWRRTPCFYHAAILRFVISATAKLWASLEILFWHLLSCEQGSKSFIWRLLNVSKAKKNLLMFANGFYQCSISQNCRLIGCVYMLTFRAEFSKIDADDIYSVERFLGIFCAQILKFGRKFVYQS